MLDGVLLAPESRMNLVSVGQLSIQYDVEVVMDHKGVVIKNNQESRMDARLGEARCSTTMCTCWKNSSRQKIYLLTSKNPTPISSVIAHLQV
jgi:hypothetical protein